MLPVDPKENLSRRFLILIRNLLFSKKCYVTRHVHNQFIYLCTLQWCKKADNLTTYFQSGTV